MLKSISLPSPLLRTTIDRFNHPMPLHRLIEIGPSPLLTRGKGFINTTNPPKSRYRSISIHFLPIPFLLVLRSIRAGWLMQKQLRRTKRQKHALAYKLQGAVFAVDYPFDSLGDSVGGGCVHEADCSSAFEDALDHDGIDELARFGVESRAVGLNPFDRWVCGGSSRVQGLEFAEDEAEGV